MSVSIQPVTEAELSISFRSTYTSRSLNEKFKVLPRGVVRGFRVTPSGASNDVWTLDVDTLLGESVMNAVGTSPTLHLYSVTYRTITPVSIDLSAAAADRYYIAFVPNYTITATTTGEWVAFTEAEFENGDLVAAGGVFVCSLLATGNASLPLAKDVLFAGRSFGGAPTLFMREDMDNFRGDQGSHYKALLTDATPEPYLGDWLPTSGPAASFGQTEIHNGAGSIEIVTTGALTVGSQHPVWQEDASLTTGTTATVVVQAWYKTDGAWNGTADVDLVFYDDLGATAKASAAGVLVPSYESIPSSVQAAWRLLRYEMKIPTTNSGFGVNATHVEIEVASTITAGTLYFGRVQMWITHRPSSTAGDFSRSYAKSAVNKVVLASDGKVEFRGSPSATDEPVSIASSGNAVLTFDSDKSSASFDYEFRASGGAAASLNLYGNGNGDSSKIEAIGASLETDQFIRTPQLRPDTGSTVLVKTLSGLDDATLECRKMRLLEIRSIATGPTPISVFDEAGDDNVTLNAFVLNGTTVTAGTSVAAPSVIATGASGIVGTDNAAGYVRTDVIRALTNTEIDVRNSTGGNTAVLNVGTVDVSSISGVQQLSYDSVGRGFGKASNVPTNTFKRASQCISWSAIRLTTDGGGVVTVDLDDPSGGGNAYNVESVTAGASSIDVNFDTIQVPSMDGADYTVVCTAAHVEANGTPSTPIFFARVGTRTDEWFRIIIQDSAGAAITLTSINNWNIEIHFCVFGKQFG